MHPLNDKNFGTSGIQISFHNGVEIVTGYIVKQLGSTKFKVSDGTANYTVVLAPTTAMAASLTAGYMTISFTNPTGGTEYVKHFFTKTVVSTDVTKTTAGNTYSWAFTKPANGVVLAALSGLDFVTNLAAPTIATTSIGITWTAPIVAPASYVIQYRVTGTSSWTGTTAIGSATTKSITGLAANTSYDIQVAPVVGSTTEVYRQVQSGTAPDVVTSVASTPAANRLTLAWTAPASTTGVSYLVQYKVHAAPTYTTFVPAPTATSAILTGLVSGTQYDVKVSSMNSRGTSATQAGAPLTGVSTTTP